MRQYCVIFYTEVDISFDVLNGNSCFLLKFLIQHEILSRGYIPYMKAKTILIFLYSKLTKESKTLTAYIGCSI